MANENKDVLRVEVTKANMTATLRNKQSGVCSDTKEYAHKLASGEMVYYPPSTNIIMDSSNVNYTNDASLVTNVHDALDELYTSGNLTYIPEGVTRAAVGGIALGTDLGTSSIAIDTLLSDMLYPYLSPSASISGGNTRELGSDTTCTLSWTATRNDQPITLITVDGATITPTGNTQSGSQGADATQNVTTTFTLSVGDGTNTVNATTLVYWQSQRYWGHFATFTAPTDGNILALDGAGVGDGSELATSYAKTLNGIDGAGDYLCFAWPTSFGLTPTFIVNGLPNTAFTKIRSASDFTNASSYVVAYDVWLSNTQQNEPIDLFSIQ